MNINPNTHVIELIPHIQHDFFDDSPEFKWYNKDNYIQKKSPGSEKTLLILPCNSGASKGNYFLAGRFPYYSNNWRKADKWLRNMRNDILFAAHSSVEFYFPDGNGAFVFEFENERVCSSDDKGVPFAKEFSYDNNDDTRFSIPKMVEDLKHGIKRALDYGITRFVAVETPLAYKTSLFRAVDDLDMWDVFTIIDSRIGTMDLNLKLVNIVLRNQITGYLYHNVYSYKMSDKMRQTLPKPYRFDLSKQYKNIDELGIIFKEITGSTFKHKYPLMIDDIDMDLDALILKYNFPYKTPLYVI